MLKQLARADWPDGALFGQLVVMFNSEKGEEVAFLCDGQRYTCWLQWANFIRIRPEVAVALLGAVIPYAMFQPTNHGGLVVVHHEAEVIGLFNHDHGYYLQYGEVSWLATSDSPTRVDCLVATYHRLSDGALDEALATVLSSDASEDTQLYELCLRNEFASRGQMQRFWDRKYAAASIPSR